MGGLQKRGLPIRDAFCVQAAIAPSSSLFLGGKKAGEGEVCFKGSTLLINDQVFENSVSNRNLGRKPKQFAVWKGSLTRLPCVWGKMEPWVCEDRRELSHISVWCLETTERGCVSVP